MDAKARELADMIGEVSIKTVDTTEFEEGSIRKKEIQAEGFMTSKVSQVPDRYMSGSVMVLLQCLGDGLVPSPCLRGWL